MIDPRTLVPSFSPVKSKVVPAGTATLLSTIVEQDFLPLMAAAAPVDPEKVQLEARSSMWVATGLARVEAMPQAASKREVRSMVVEGGRM